MYLISSSLLLFDGPARIFKLASVTLITFPLAKAGVQRLPLLTH